MSHLPAGDVDGHAQAAVQRRSQLLEQLPSQHRLTSCAIGAPHWQPQRHALRCAQLHLQCRSYMNWQELDNPDMQQVF